MTATKIVGGVCGSFLIFLLLKWGAEVIYHPNEGVELEQAYVIDTGAENSVTADVVAADAGPDFATVLASADVAAGAKTFGKCKACHKLEEGAKGVGPSLFGVVGRAQGTLDGFAYSDAVAGLGGTWTPEELNNFLTGPKAYAPGTKMGFKGLSKITDRANVIAYLSTIGN